MINNKIVLVAFPDELKMVGKIDVKIIMQRLLRIEQRMKKGVNLDDEYQRYHLYCDRLENCGAWLAGQPGVMVDELGESYLEFIAQCKERVPELTVNSRMMSNFCPAEMIEEQIRLWIEADKAWHVLRMPVFKKKFDFYKLAAQKKLNVVEILEFSADATEVQNALSTDLHELFEDLPVSDEVVVLDDSSNARSSLLAQFATVIRNQQLGIRSGLNFSDMGHTTITEVLHEMAYGLGTKTVVPVIYGDGSEARPLTIRCLRYRRKEQREAFKAEPMINVGMMSQRHEELDSHVSVYFFRNQDLSVGKRAAEIDELAYKQAKEMFVRMRKEGKYRIGFYQTGFQPVVVGFYRALIEELLSQQGSEPLLQVTPFYFYKDHYQKGEVWF